MAGAMAPAPLLPAAAFAVIALVDAMLGDAGADADTIFAEAGRDRWRPTEIGPGKVTHRRSEVIVRKCPFVAKRLGGRRHFWPTNTCVC